MGTSLEAFADSVGEFMHVIARESLKYQAVEFQKMRLTMPQFIILAFLQKEGERKMTELARGMNVTTAAVTGVVDKLVRERYVVRSKDPSDRRVIKISLTKKGSGIIGDVLKKRKETVIRIFGMISQKERDEYLRILEHIRDHLEGRN